MISPASKIGILLANALRTIIATAMDYSLIHVGPLYTKFYKRPTGYTSVASPWSVIMIDTHSLFTRKKDRVAGQTQTKVMRTVFPGNTQTL